MKYIAQTVSEYIVKEAKRGTGIVRFVLPSYPPQVLVPIGLFLESALSQMEDREFRLQYGIARKLGDEWRSGTEQARSHYEMIQNKGWHNVDDNLTSLRNANKPPESCCVVVVLAGYEHISDRASLKDFFHLDQQAIWSLCMDSSFSHWIKLWLSNDVNPDGNEGMIRRIAALFREIWDYGLSDLVGISAFLDARPPTGAITGEDAYRAILRNLSPFGLPNMIGLARRHDGQSLRRYFSSAQSFFSYGMFLDVSARDRASSAINEFRNKYREEPSSEILGSFSSVSDLLDSCQTYVQTGAATEIAKLRTADFPFILDKILNHKLEEPTRPKRIAPRRLRGLAPEVFLHAAWLTLGDFARESRIRSALSVDEIASITFTGLTFKHDFEDDDELNPDHARVFLLRAIGGIDALLEKGVRLDLGEDRFVVECRSHILPPDGTANLQYSYSPTSEPYLEFEVAVSCRDGNSCVRRFRWMLPDGHQARLTVELFELAHSRYAVGGNALPLYTMPFIGNLFSQHDEESVGRTLSYALQSGRCSRFDLIPRQGLGVKDGTRKLLQQLSSQYQEVIRKFRTSGFFAALEMSHDTRTTLKEVYRNILDCSESSALGPMLMKAFLIAGISEGSAPDIAWREYLTCAVATPLHPAVMDMLVHQHAYLCESFCIYAAKALENLRDGGFSEKNWHRLTDLARVQRPLLGILKDADRVLNTNVRSFGYVHLIGVCKEEPSPESGLRIEYDETDEDIQESDLFRETRDSQLISQVLTDYVHVHPYAADGISLAAYCGGEIQPIIAGVDGFLSDLLSDRSEHPYTLRLTVISDANDDLSVTRWISAWRSRWQQHNAQESRDYYRRCRISVVLKVVSGARRIEDLIDVFRHSRFDVSFFQDFIGSTTSRFEQLSADTVFGEGYRKFPILEKICCPIIDGGRENQRERVLSNSRFTIATLHSEIMARIQHSTPNPGIRHAVVSSSDFGQWVPVVDAAHESSSWVVCIDPAVDERLVRRDQGEDTKRRRDIIGFGTGVGPHGEFNYTVSTEHFSIVDIQEGIASQVALLFNLEKDRAQCVAKALVSEASRIGGLSIVKATGPSQYIRDYIAYAMVRRMLPPDPTCFCDVLVSLDAYRHWFAESPGSIRPDLLRFQARLVNGYFHIDAQVIECKLASQLEGYLEKARQQIESGLRQLCIHFRPKDTDLPSGIGDRPDERYWWMQLHRLAATRGSSTRAGYPQAIAALERLSEGLFSISWQACVLAIWTDVEDLPLRYAPEWSYELESQSMGIYVAQAGKHLVEQVCLADNGPNILWEGAGISYEAASVGTPSDGRHETVEAEAEAEAHGLGEVEVAQPKDQSPDQLEPERVARIPDRILLGRGTAGGRDVYWEFGHPDLPNRHILLFGSSGTGKTYTIQALIAELGKSLQNCLIVDYTNGFTNKQLDPVLLERFAPRQHLVRKQPLPINPFRRQSDSVDDIVFEEEPANTAQRVTGVFSEVYQLGDQQKSALYTAIRDGVTQEGSSFDLRRLVQRLEGLRAAGGPTGNSAASVISKIQPFVDMNPFGQEDAESWEKLFTDPISRCHVIQLAGFMKDAARLVTEFSLIDLYWYYRARGNKDKPRVIILDEIQNLDHRLESPLGQFLTEGRKFGISLILATQTLSNLEKDERDRLFQASHKLFFKPADTEIRTFATILAGATNDRVDEWVTRLTSLKRGECYSLGYSLNEATGKLEVNKWSKIRIKSLAERF